MSQSKAITKNILFGFITKVASLALSIIIPRLFIISFGSEVNGLISTVTQIFTYLALLEAGIGNATVNALYKPIKDASINQSNEVLSQARTFYRKVTIIYFLCVALFAFVYPLIVRSTIDKKTILLIIVLQGIANCITYFFCSVYDQLLMASGHRYVTENIALVIHIFSTVVRIVLINCGFNVIAVQSAYFFVLLIRIPLTIIFCHRKFPWLDFKVISKTNHLKERNAFVIHELSATIFSSTDVFVISTFCNFALASVYTVYNLVFSSLNSMINSMNQGLGFILGNNVDEDNKKLCEIYDVYSRSYTTLVFCVISIAYVMILPFVQLYTKGANDVDYLISGLPVLFSIISLMSGSRAVAARLITVSGHAKDTQNRSIIEMVINLGVSLILVQFIGIYGVLFGTIIALLYRVNDILIYTNKKILNRNPFKEYLYLIVLSIVFVIIVIITNMFKLGINNYFDFVINGLIVSLVVSILYICIFFLFNRKTAKMLLNYLKNKKMFKV